jgi:hypothetical protein
MVSESAGSGNRDSTESRCKRNVARQLRAIGTLDGRPPPYHAIQTATGGSQWQRSGASSSHFPAFREPNVCHGLRPLCSIAVPSQWAQKRVLWLGQRPQVEVDDPFRNRERVVWPAFEATDRRQPVATVSACFYGFRARIIFAGLRSASTALLYNCSTSWRLLVRRSENSIHTFRPRPRIPAL